MSRSIYDAEGVFPCIDEIPFIEISDIHRTKRGTEQLRDREIRIGGTDVRGIDGTGKNRTIESIRQILQSAGMIEMTMSGDYGDRTCRRVRSDTLYDGFGILAGAGIYNDRMIAGDEIDIRIVRN